MSSLAASPGSESPPSIRSPSSKQSISSRSVLPVFAILILGGVLIVMSSHTKLGASRAGRVAVTTAADHKNEKEDETAPKWVMSADGKTKYMVLGKLPPAPTQQWINLPPAPTSALEKIDEEELPTMAPRATKKADSQQGSEIRSFRRREPLVHSQAELLSLKRRCPLRLTQLEAEHAWTRSTNFTMHDVPLRVQPKATPSGKAPVLLLVGAAASVETPLWRNVRETFDKLPTWDRVFVPHGLMRDHLAGARVSAEILKTYDAITDPVLQEQFFVYVFLLQNGGLYIDAQMVLLPHFEEALEKLGKGLLAVGDVEDKRRMAFLRSAKKDDPQLKRFVDEIVAAPADEKAGHFGQEALADGSNKHGEVLAITRKRGCAISELSIQRGEKQVLLFTSSAELILANGAQHHVGNKKRKAHARRS